MCPRLGLALALALCWSLAAPGEGVYLAHAPPVVAAPWRRALLPCECANATLDCSERGLEALGAAARAAARRCGGVRALALAGNRLHALPDALGAHARVVNASHNRLRQLPTPAQVSAEAWLLDLSDNRITSPADDALRHLRALRTLRLGRNRGLRHLRFLPDPCALVHLEAGEGDVASLDGPLPRCACLETLDLSGNRLAAAPRAALAPLRRLRVLDLSWNRIAPLPPDMFAGLAQLTDLRLDSIGLESLPDGMLANLSRLASLSLVANPLTRLSDTDFHGLNSLRFLSVDFTDIVSLPDNGLGNLTSLEEVHLSYIGLTTLPRTFFASLPRLKLIGLSNNNISSLPSDIFSGLSQLDTVFLAYNPLLVFPSNLLAGLPSLQMITLSHNLLQNPIPELLNISIVECFQCGITSLPSRSFAQWRNTKALSVSENNIQTVDNDAFVGLSSLSYLNFASNNLSSLPATLFSPLRNLTRLYLSSNSLKVLPDSIFAGLSEVMELALNENHISELPQHVFRDLISLRRLDVSNNKLTSLPEGIFDHLGALWELNVADNKLTRLPVSPAGCEALRAVSFGRNNISHIDETAMRSWLFSEERDLFLNLEDSFARIPLNSMGWVTTLPEVVHTTHSEDVFGRTLLTIRRKSTVVILSTSSSTQSN